MHWFGWCLHIWLGMLQILVVNRLHTRIHTPSHVIMSRPTTSTRSAKTAYFPQRVCSMSTRITIAVPTRVKLCVCQHRFLGKVDLSRFPVLRTRKKDGFQAFPPMTVSHASTRQLLQDAARFITADGCPCCRPCASPTPAFQPETQLLVLEIEGQTLISRNCRPTPSGLCLGSPGCRQRAFPLWGPRRQAAAVLCHIVWC